MTNSRMNIVRWIGSILAIIGALILAANVPGLSQWGWVLFQVSSVFWIWTSVAAKDWALLSMQIVFVCVNFLGIYRGF